MKLSDRCADPDDDLDHVDVVNDQVGRLTFTDEMAESIFFLLGYRKSSALIAPPLPCGIYNLTESGREVSWAEIAREVFELANGNGVAVRPVSSEEYYAGANRPITLRPAYSVLDLSKIETACYIPHDWRLELSGYVAKFCTT